MLKTWVIISMDQDEISYFDIILCQTKRICIGKPDRLESSHNVWYNVATIVITNIHSTSYP